MTNRIRRVPSDSYRTCPTPHPFHSHSNEQLIIQLTLFYKSFRIHLSVIHTLQSVYLTDNNSPLFTLKTTTTNLNFFYIINQIPNSVGNFDSRKLADLLSAEKLFPLSVSSDREKMVIMTASRTGRQLQRYNNQGFRQVVGLVSIFL